VGAVDGNANYGPQTLSAILFFLGDLCRALLQILELSLTRDDPPAAIV
jgi:hypothetical protein